MSNTSKEEQRGKSSLAWLWLTLACLVAILLLVCGGSIVGAVLVITKPWQSASSAVASNSGTSSNSSQSQVSNVSSGSLASPSQSLPESSAIAEQSPWTVIFQHSPRESVGKVVKRGDPIPPGWVGGTHIVSAEYYEREIQISAILAGAKEGETARITKLGR